MTDGEDDPSSTLGFAELGVAPPLLKALREVGYETPSPIQATTIPALLGGRHLVGLARTGTGKTAAFALPILQNLHRAGKPPQALVLTPTRELALQVCEAFERYAAHQPWVRVLPVYGGQGYGVQLSALARGVHVVVGTPGRIIDHLDRGTLDLTQLRFLVLDEADEMLTMGFAEDVERILAGTPDDKQVALFSATMPAPIRRLAQRYLADALEVDVKSNAATPSTTRQRAMVVSYPQKVDVLTRVLEVENFDAMIVFVRTRQATETVAERLRARGFSATAISGDVAQPQRERTIDQLRKGKLDILVATDVAARGLDVDRISHVVNFDIPADPQAYVHRIGRTGRAGRTGEALTLVTPRERGQLREIERGTGATIEIVGVPTVSDVNETRVARFADAVSGALDSPHTADYLDLVERFEREQDVPAAQIAAALAVLVHDGSPLLLGAEDELPAAKPTRDKGERDKTDRDKGTRSAHGERASRGDRGPRVTYRIAVGKRQKVEPRQIVGAIANEGGLSRDDFGRIDIRGDHSLVELPARLPDSSWQALKSTRIGGKLIELTPDRVSSPAARSPRARPAPRSTTRPR